MLEGYQKASEETDNETEEMLEGYQKASEETDNETEEMLEGYQSDLKEETFSKNSFLLKELNEFFYNEGIALTGQSIAPSYIAFGDVWQSLFFNDTQFNDTQFALEAPPLDTPASYLLFENLQKYTNQFIYPSLPYSFTKIGSDKFANFIASFSNDLKNINDVNEFEFFDSIQTLILNLEKTQINLTLPEHIIHLRPLSGYKYPDMEIAKLRTFKSKIENVCKYIIFPHKQRYESLIEKVQIEVPSSFVDDLANGSPYMEYEKKDTSNIVLQSPIFSFLTNEAHRIQQLNFHYLPDSQTLFNQNLTEKSSGIYQKVMTIYKEKPMRSKGIKAAHTARAAKSFDRTIKNFFNTNKERGPQAGNSLPLLTSPSAMSGKDQQFNTFSVLYGQSPFCESWEPVTSQSWLVITKVSFILSAVKLFKRFLATYVKELGFLRFIPENFKEELGLIDEKKDKGYRVIKKVKKRFKDVVGIDNILPELSELVWFLRHSGRTFKVGNFLPKGFLFVGPPGTGKTVLVQAIAGEALVPVLVQSGSALSNSGGNEKGAQRLIKLFEQARKIAPCIVFIDEIDTLGESRHSIMRTKAGPDVETSPNFNQGSSDTYLFEGSSGNFVDLTKPGNIAEKQSRGDITRNTNTLISHGKMLEGDKKKSQVKQQTNQEQLNLLMQFLVELDGLKSRAGVIVIGATNRPKVLDPALTRPGRFDRVLNLEIPGKTKRIEILKFYSQNIGLTMSSIATKEQIETKINVAKELQSNIGPLLINENKQINTSTDALLTSPLKDTNRAEGDVTLLEGDVTLSATKKKKYLKQKKPNSYTLLQSKNQHIFNDFPWEYLANRTFGFSTAALATAMNESSLKAILRDTGHTIETIDQGIEVITSYSIKKPKIETREVKKDKTNKRYVETTSLNKSYEKERGPQVKDTGNSLPLQKQSSPSAMYGKDQGGPDPFLITRFAYYQAGKAVLHTLLPQHPDALFLKLWPQPKNSRYKENSRGLTSNNNRAKLETRLIGLYAGKAAELLALELHSHIKDPKVKATGPFIASSLLSGERNTNKKKKNYKVNASSEYELRGDRLPLLTSSLRDTNKVTSPSNITDGDVTLLEGDVTLSGNAKTGGTKGPHKQTKKLRFSNPNNFTKSETKTRFLFQFQIKNKGFVSNLSQNDKKGPRISHSNLGLEDLSAASNLAHSLVEKWHFYSNKIAIRRENQIFNNQNQFETSEIEVFELFQQLTEDLQNRIKASNISESHIREQRDKYSRFNFQECVIRPWWQDQITQQTRNLNMFYDDWYRIYLPDPEESERNEEWVKPDEYYHNTQNLKNLLTKRCPEVRDTARDCPLVYDKKDTGNDPLKNTLNFDITWNDLYKIDRDYIYHALILTCFNKAFSLLDENRELLDYLADYLMRFETLRQHKIKEIFYDFGSPKLENKS